MTPHLIVHPLGDLTEEFVILQADSPVLSVYTSGNNSRFLVESIDFYGGEFVIIPIDIETLVKLLESSMDMYDVFKEASVAYVTTEDDNYELIGKEYPRGEIPDEFCPKRVPLGFTNGRIAGYIEKIRGELVNSGKIL